jgi:hypothetical protein
MAERCSVPLNIQDAIMKDIFSTAAVIASIAIAIALMFLVPIKLEANPGPPIVSSHQANAE